MEFRGCAAVWRNFLSCQISGTGGQRQLYGIWKRSSKMQELPCCWRFASSVLILDPCLLPFNEWICQELLPHRKVMKWSAHPEECLETTKCCECYKWLFLNTRSRKNQLRNNRKFHVVFRISNNCGLLNTHCRLGTRPKHLLYVI